MEKQLGEVPLKKSEEMTTQRRNELGMLMLLKKLESENRTLNKKDAKGAVKRISKSLKISKSEAAEFTAQVLDLLHEGLMTKLEKIRKK